MTGAAKATTHTSRINPLGVKTRAEHLSMHGAAFMSASLVTKPYIETKRTITKQTLFRACRVDLYQSAGPLRRQDELRQQRGARHGLLERLTSRGPYHLRRRGTSEMDSVASGVAASLLGRQLISPPAFFPHLF